MYNLLFANGEGQLLDYPLMAMAGLWGDHWVEAGGEEMIPLPPGATLVMIPERHPVGIVARTGKFRQLLSNPYRKVQEPVWAVGALLPQGYTRTLLPAFTRPAGGRCPLPLLGYTAVGVQGGAFFAAARATDGDDRWNPCHYNTPDLPGLVGARLDGHPDNRILRQLAGCALDYGCFTAQNIFYQRWEGGLPISPHCNARCLGCISRQPSECCPSPQERIKFYPTVREMVEVAVPHLQHASEGIISCGQGCEGEPTLRAGDLAAAIAAVRGQTARGTFNVNTNAGLTAGITRLCQAGVDSLRVSLNSALPDTYQAYYRPRRFHLAEVVASLKTATGAGVFTSVNLLAFPGVTDREEEIEALVKLVQGTGICQIQLRNLNIDPDEYMAVLPAARSRLLGMTGFLAILARELPHVMIGNYSRPVK